eukprot:2071915-Rhodomonas_salina.1
MDAKTKDMVPIFSAKYLLAEIARLQPGKKSIALGVSLLEQEPSIATPPPGSRCMGGVTTAQGVDSELLLPDGRPDELL